jgi:hypothetical protein
MDPREYDSVYGCARRQRRSVQDVIRAALQRFLADERGGLIKNRK